MKLKTVAILSLLMTLMICSASAEVILIPNEQYDLSDLDWSDGESKYIIDRPDAVEWLVMGEEIETLTEENKELRGALDESLALNQSLEESEENMEAQRNVAYTIGGVSFLITIIFAIFH
jgi:hypothetical protein